MLLMKTKAFIEGHILSQTFVEFLVFELLDLTHFLLVFIGSGTVLFHLSLGPLGWLACNALDPKRSWVINLKCLLHVVCMRVFLQLERLLIGLLESQFLCK